MTSKEALEKICLHCEHYHQDMCYRAIAGCEEWHKLEKDLKELEELKKIMGTPIQDIMKRLKILEIIKNRSFFDTFYWKDNDTTYDRFLCNIHTKGMKEDFEKVKEWWNNEK